MDVCRRDFSISIPSMTMASLNETPATQADLNTKTAQREDNAEDKTTRKKGKKVTRRRHQCTEESFQKEIDKWEEFYDDMKAYLTDGVLLPRNQSIILKQADTFFVGPDNVLYYRKTVQGCAMTLKLPVIRSYKERMQVCRAIHLSTGEECIHHRRDTMLELLGQQYYWKGQRRDVCQCIASCDMCSLGLGGKRRAKPPGQKRDVRPQQKLLKVTAATNPPASSSSSSSSAAAAATTTKSQRHGRKKNIPLSTAEAGPTQCNHPTTNSMDVTHYSSCAPLPATSFTITSNSAFTAVNPLSNLHTIADACLSTSTDSGHDSSLPFPLTRKANTGMNIASEVVVSNNSGLQIFTTINEPYHENHQGTDRHAASDQLPLNPTLCVDTEVISGINGDEEQYVVQGSSSCVGGRTGDDASSLEPSIYQLLFQLPSVPNTNLCTAVIESMQMSLKTTTDPAQLAQASSQSLVSVFTLTSSASQALVCPNRAAAYVTSLIAIFTKQGLLSTTSRFIQMSSPPPIILHDAACKDVCSPKVLSSLVGACNWNLGTRVLPMDQTILQAAIASNRVSTVLYRPFSYPENANFLSLNALSLICGSQNVAIVADCSDMSDHSLVQVTSTVKNMLTAGADLIMLPNTDRFQGPPHTCILIGKTDILGPVWKQLTLLQSEMPIPLLCPAYDTVGTVIAFRSLQVSGIKAE